MRFPAKGHPFNLLQPLYTTGPLSRAELVEISNLAPSQVTVVIRRAFKAGLIVEAGVAPSNGGRPRSLLQPNPDFAQLIGIDLGRTRIRFMVTDFAGNRLAFKAYPIEAPNHKDDLFGLINQEVRTFRTQYPKVAAIGLSVSGVIDPKAGTMLFWPMIEGWSGTPLRQILEKEHGLPAYVEDSVRAMAIAEHRFGQGRGVRNFVFVCVGMGIGSAIFFDNHLLVGRDGLAGELGHTTVDENGPACGCGNQGCLELYSSATAILNRVRSDIERGVASSLATGFTENEPPLTIEGIVRAAELHDRLAERVLSEAGTHLGTALASVVNLLNPEKVILAGSVPRAAGQLLLGPLLYSLRQRALPPAVKSLPLVVSDLGEESAPLGMILRAREGVLAARCEEIAGRG